MSAILVCGLSRCGTSMLMKMLHGGGLPVYAGNHSSYEHDDLCGVVDMRRMLPILNGFAAKLIDPHRSTWPTSTDAKVLWMNRDPKQQALSIVKFLQAVNGFTIPKKAALSIEGSLIEDRPSCMNLFRRIGACVLPLSFESVLSEPLESAMRIAGFLGADLRIHKMADVVLPRSPKCASDMSHELNLVAENT